MEHPGCQYDRQERFLLASAELYDIDILAVQEAVQPIDGSPDTATELARLGGMHVASFIPAGVVNSVSKDQMASAILTRLEIVESNIKITAPAEETDSAIGEHKQYAAALLKTKTDRLVLMVSVHLSWGGQKEYRRLKHAELINAQIESIMNNLPKGSMQFLLVTLMHHRLLILCATSEVSLGCRITQPSGLMLGMKRVRHGCPIYRFLYDVRLL